MHKFIAAAATLVLLTASQPSWAQTVEQDGPEDEYSVATEHAQNVFLDYHRAVRAEVDCRQAAFSSDDMLAIDRATAQQMVAESPQISMGAARLLTLRGMADDQMDHIVSREGCDGQKVKKALAFYDERLANVHPVPQQPLPGPQPVDAQAPAAGDTMAAPGGAAPMDAAPESLVPAAQTSAQP
jgi:hypothetical protein